MCDYYILIYIENFGVVFFHYLHANISLNFYLTKWFVPPKYTDSVLSLLLLYYTMFYRYFPLADTHITPKIVSLHSLHSLVWHKKGLPNWVVPLLRHSMNFTLPLYAPWCALMLKLGSLTWNAVVRYMFLSSNRLPLLIVSQWKTCTSCNFRKNTLFLRQNSNTVSFWYVQIFCFNTLEI